MISRLGVGPMSSEIIEAVFRLAEKKQEPLMLIASKNQIDWDRGYVNTWSTDEYMEYIRAMRQKYPRAKVFICRDHCGPGFKNNDLADVYKTIDSDIANGFDLIHVDFCHWPGGDHQQILEESKKAIAYIHSKNPEVLIEIGTDENRGDFLTDLNKVKKELEFFANLPKVVYYVCQTGSLIKEMKQVGHFNVEFIKQVKQLAKKYNLALKEHNADYLEKDKIKLRKSLIDAVNVAPQYGVLQTQLTLAKCVTYGLDPSPWLELCHQSGRWGKWLQHNNKDNKLFCSIIAGHYNFSTPAYQKIYQKISEQENFRETIIQAVEQNLKLYLDNL